MYEVNTDAFNDLWPFNMINALSSISEIDIGEITINGINNVLSTIEERDRYALYLRFKGGMTYEEIGQRLNITRERSRQLVHRGLEQLSLKRDLMLTVPMSKYKKLDRNHSLLQDTVGKYKAIVEYREEVDASHFDKKISKITIEELELSVRAYHCLCKAGIRTLKDLTLQTEDDLLNIRNMGVKTYKEIVSKMSSYGASLASVHS